MAVRATNAERRTVRWRILLMVGAIVVALYFLLNAQKWLMPARALRLTDTVWRVESVDGALLADLTATMTFLRVGPETEPSPFARDRAVLSSECGVRTFGYSWDSDDVSIEFWVLSAATRTCSGTAAADEQRIVTTLLATTHWRVNADDEIELKGESTLGLTR